MDRVFIEGLEIEAVIGIYAWERRIRQPLVFDLEMAFDNRRPAATDAIADTLDYKAVSKRLIAFVSHSSFGLVETLAERCAAIVLHEFDVEHVRLKLSKPGAVRGARAVGVVIERNRADTPPPAQDSIAPPKATSVAPAAAPPPPPALAPVAAEPPAAAQAPVQATPARRASDRPKPAAPAPVRDQARAATPRPAEAAPAPSRADAMIAALTGVRDQAPAHAPPSTAQDARKLAAATCPAYLSLGSNIEPERNLRMALAALRARFGELQVSPVYRTRAVGFDGPDFLNAVAIVQSDLNPFALHRWLHRLEEAQGRDRRDATYSNRPLDIDIIYFGDFVLDGPGDFQLPRPELQHAFVLKPLADIAPDFVDPIRNISLAQLWAIHPDHDAPPPQVALAL